MEKRLRIKAARWGFVSSDGAESEDGAEPVLFLEFADSRNARVFFPQKFLYYGYSAAMIAGDGFEDLPPLQYPGDHELGLPAKTLRGATTDPDVVALARAFDNAVRLGNFIPIADVFKV
jgi:hypothetical protein